MEGNDTNINSGHLKRVSCWSSIKAGFAWGCFKIESFAESGKFGGCLEIYKGIMQSTSPKV